MFFQVDVEKFQILGGYYTRKEVVRLFYVEIFRLR